MTPTAGLIESSLVFLPPPRTRLASPTFSQSMRVTYPDAGLSTSSRLPAFLDGWRPFAQIKHPGRQFDTEVGQVARSAAAQHFDAFDHFEGVAHGASQRLVHVGDQGDDSLAHALTGRDHELGEIDR